jgi:hypothetical protein
VGAILIEGPNRRTHFSRLPTMMAAKLKIEKRVMKLKKKSSPLKLLSQSQPNFAEMILGWFPFKIVYAYTVQIWALSGLK